MPALISLLRGINLGPHRRLKMASLCELYASLKLGAPQSYLQSGNVVFSTSARDLPKLASRLEYAFEAAFGFRSDILLRTAGELAEVVQRNPFAGRADVPPNKLLVTFLKDKPSENAHQSLKGLKIAGEELVLLGRELYVFFPNGSGRSKLSAAALDRALGTVGTARNWNTLLGLLALARQKV